MVTRSSKPLPNGWMAGFALREESPTIIRHLTEGCPTCNAGLQVFHHAAAPADGPGDGQTAWAAAVEQLERQLTAGLAASGSPVNALHAALADLAVRRQAGLRR